MITPRPYQQNAADTSIKMWNEGRRWLMYVMAVGTGKTETFLLTLAMERKRLLDAGEPFRAIIFAHSKELIEQPTHRIAQHWQTGSLTLRIPGIVQGKRNEPDREIIAATIQSITPRAIPTPAPVFENGEQVFFQQGTGINKKEWCLYSEGGQRLAVRHPEKFSGSEEHLDDYMARLCDPAQWVYVHYGSDEPLQIKDPSTSTGFGFVDATFANYKPFAAEFRKEYPDDRYPGLTEVKPLPPKALDPETGEDLYADIRWMQYENNIVSPRPHAQSSIMKRRVRPVLDDNFGAWDFVYDDTGEPYAIPAQRKTNPVRIFKRLRQILAHGKFSHIVIDEAHHSVSPTYRSVIRALEWTCPDLRGLGVTATPFRLDDIPMAEIYEGVAQHISLHKAVYILRCLCNFEIKAVTLPDGAADIIAGSRGDDFSQAELTALGNVMSTPHALDCIVDAYEKADGHERLTMIYTGSVAQAEQLAEAFQDRGYAAEWASGETPVSERDAILERFRDGITRILVNCELWTEGLDIPEIALIMLVRLTKSIAKVIQMIGRGLRLHEIKRGLTPPALILTCYPEDTPIDLQITDRDLLGDPEDRKKEIERERENPDADIPLLDALENAATVDELNNVLDSEDRPEVELVRLNFYRSKSKLDWTVGQTFSSAAIAQNHILIIVPPQRHRIDRAMQLLDGGQWNHKWDADLEKISSYQLFTVNGDLGYIGHYGEWDDAAMAAQVYADENADPRMAHRDQGWREYEPTDKQYKKARAIGVENPEQFSTRGDLSKAISHKVARDVLIYNKVIRND